MDCVGPGKPDIIYLVLSKINHALIAQIGKIVLIVVLVGLFAFTLFTAWVTASALGKITNRQDQLEDIFTDSLFEDHLRLSEKMKLDSKLSAVQAQLDELLAIKENTDYLALTEIYTLHADLVTKINRNTGVKLSLAEYDAAVDSLGGLLLEKKFTEMKTAMATVSTGLEADYEEYLATLPPPPSISASGEGYSFVNVGIGRGTFGVSLIKVPLSSVRVVTAAASDGDCSDNCPTKSLAQHVADNGGFAGMNAGYFCPPDYSECNGKVNTSDYAFYKSSSGDWLNEDALSWGDTALATFSGSSARFYKRSSDYGGGGVSAGVSNYPSLVSGGNISVDEGILSSYQKDARGPRGAIGVGDSNLYLAIISNATVIDAAHVMQALGAKDALNLDGGGSSALYINGGYAVGPGRSLPNAIVLTR